MLSDKALRIMKVLVMNRNTPITVKMLSVMLDMSERTANTYLKEVGSFCDKQEINYVGRRGVGVYLELEPEDMNGLPELFVQQTPYYDEQDRQFYIRQILLQGWGNYTISLFAEELYVSRQVIGADLDEAEHWFQNYEITILRKSRTGVTANGTEVGFRSALAALFREQKVELQEEGLSCDYRIGIDKTQHLYQVYERDLVKGVCRALQLFEAKSYLVFVDYSIIMMVEYLCVQIKRMERGYMVKEEELVFLSPGRAGSVLSESLADTLEYVCGVRYPAKERSYIYLLLSGAEFQQEEHVRQEDQSARQQVEEICSHIVSYLSAATGLDFYKEKRLFSGLESFLYKCIVRTRCGFEIRNPFLEDVKTNYGIIFNTCFGMGAYIREVIGRIPSEHEIAFLTLLIGGALIRIEKRVNAVLVGAGSLFLAEMTTKKIEKRLDGLRIIAVLSKDELDKAQALSCDMVITTIQGLKCDLPAVYVTPVVDDRDALRLQKACSEVFTLRLGRPEQVTLSSYIHPEFILLDVETVSKNKLIEMGFQVLRDYGCVTDRYYKEVLYRETISSTEIGNGVAIPHGIENSVLIPAVCMIRLKQKIDWGSAPVDIIFMLALNFNDGETTRRFFKLFYEKAGNENIIKLLRTARTEEDIMEILQ
ncbi:BglG family transcription antiterminator [Lacrimispora sp.]|uniref:BglG family transcription antiterminator n=1 Tax=Lacrimispora sp. TaxID=2719234 RepID=UPI00289FBA40|nr:BglG family transcription antiterminator [Lacrimispora sp.]